MISEASPLLQQILPAYDFSSQRQCTVAANVECVWSALLTSDFTSVSLIRGLLYLRGIKPRPSRSGLLEQIRPYGFVELAARQYQQIVIGTVMRPWHLGDGNVGLDLRSFYSVDRIGWVRFAVEFTFEAVDRRCTHLTMRERAHATDTKTRRALTAYWWTTRVPSALIQRAMLSDIAMRAEANADAKEKRPDQI